MSPETRGTPSSIPIESDKEECQPPVTVESTPPSILIGTVEERYVTSADESLGLNYLDIDDEVLKKKFMIGRTEESEITHWQVWGSRSRSRRMRVKSSPSDEMVNVFPPLLSTLNINGRHSYNFIRSVENGRLSIRITPNECPELVAQVDESGRLRLISITSRSQSVVEKEDDDSNDDNKEGIV